MSDTLDEHERLCHEALAQLRDSYERAAQPYFEQLARIHACRNPGIRVSVADAITLGWVPNPGAQADFMNTPIKPLVYPGKGF